MPTFRMTIDVTLEAADETDVNGQVGRYLHQLSAGAKPKPPFAKGAKVVVVEVKQPKKKGAQ